MANTNDVNLLVNAVQKAAEKATTDALVSKTTVLSPDDVTEITRIDVPFVDGQTNLLFNGYFEADGSFKVNPTGWQMENAYGTVVPYSQQPGQENADYVSSQGNYGKPALGDTSYPVTGHVAKTTSAVTKWYYIDDAASGVTYSGSWSAITNSRTSYNRTYHYCGTTGAYASGRSASITFRGTGVRVFCHKSSIAGKVNVSIDGGAPTLVDLYAAKTAYRQQVYQTTGLASGEHKLTFTPANSKNASSVGYYVYLDSFQVYAPTEVTVAGTKVGVIRAAYNQADGYYGLSFIDSQMPNPAASNKFVLLQPDLDYTWTDADDTQASCSGTWGTVTGAAYYDGSMQYSDTSGDYSTISFEGSGLKVYGTKGPDQGIATVSLDGTELFQVDLFDRVTTSNQTLLFELNGLVNETHTVVYTNSGTKNSDSTTTRINLDYYSTLKVECGVDAFSMFQDLHQGVVTSDQVYQLGFRAGHYNGYIDQERFITTGAGTAPPYFIQLSSKYLTSTSSSYFLPIYAQDTVSPSNLLVRILFKDASGSPVDEYVSDAVTLIEGGGLASYMYAFRVPRGAEQATIEFEVCPDPDAVPFAVAFDSATLSPITEGRYFVNGSDSASTATTSPDEAFAGEDTPEDLAGAGAVVATPSGTPGPPASVSAAAAFQPWVWGDSRPGELVLAIDWEAPSENVSSLYSYDLEIIDGDGSDTDERRVLSTNVGRVTDFRWANALAGHTYQINVYSVGRWGANSQPATTSITVEESLVGVSDVTSASVNWAAFGNGYFSAAWTRVSESHCEKYALQWRDSTTPYSPSTPLSAVDWNAWSDIEYIPQCPSGNSPVAYHQFASNGTKFYGVRIKAHSFHGQESSGWAESTFGAISSVSGASNVTVTAGVDVNLYSAPFIQVNWTDSTQEGCVGYNVSICDSGSPNPIYSDEAFFGVTPSGVQTYKLRNLIFGNTYTIKVWGEDAYGRPTAAATAAPFLLTTSSANYPAVPDVSSAIAVTSPSQNMVKAIWTRVDRDDIWGYSVQWQASDQVYTSTGTPTFTGEAWSAGEFCPQSASGASPVHYMTVSSGDRWYRVGLKAKTLSELYSETLVASSGVHVSTGATIPDTDLNEAFADAVGDDRVTVVSGVGLVTSAASLRYYSDDGTSSTVVSAARERQLTAFGGFIPNTSSPAERGRKGWMADTYVTTSGSLRIGPAEVGQTRVVCFDANGNRAALGQIGTFWGLYVENGAVLLRTAGNYLHLNSQGLVCSGGSSNFSLTSAGLDFATSGNRVRVSSTGIVGSGGSNSFLLNTDGFTMRTASDKVWLDATGIIGSGGSNTFQLNSTGLTISTASDSVVLDSTGIVGTVSGQNRFELTNAGLTLRSANIFISGGYITVQGTEGAVADTLRIDATSGIIAATTGRAVAQFNKDGITLAHSTSGLNCLDSNGNITTYMRDNGLVVTDAAGNKKVHLGMYSSGVYGLSISGGAILIEGLASNTLAINSSGIAGTNFRLDNSGLALSGSTINLTSGGWIRLRGTTSASWTNIDSNGMQVTDGSKDLVQVGRVSYTNYAGTPVTGHGIYVSSGATAYFEGGTLYSTNIRAGSISGASVSGTYMYGGALYGSSFWTRGTGGIFFQELSSSGGGAFVPYDIRIYCVYSSGAGTLGLYSRCVNTNTSEQFGDSCALAAYFPGGLTYLRWDVGTGL